jgi:hypothetical protein
MTDIFDATVSSGVGVASKNLKFQMPYLVWQFPAIKNIYLGSINVNLDKPLHVPKYDYTTLPTPWWDVDETHPGRWRDERFGFLEIKFEFPVGGEFYRAWIFDCHNSRYHGDPTRFEIISEKINGIANGQRCRIHILNQNNQIEPGFLTSAVKRLFDALKLLSPMAWLERFRPNVTPSAIEQYVLGSLLVEIVAAISAIKFAGWPLWLQWTVLVLAALKILEIIRVTASVVLFDEGVVASVQRTFILAALNFIELGLCYGFFYALNDQLLAPSPAGALAAFYFSFITQLTIGFGDIHPMGWLRFVAVVQGLTAALFVLLVFGKIVASLRPLQAKR